MTTDREEIRSTIDNVLSQEMYIQITRDAFEKACPCPSLVIKVVGNNPEEAIKLFQIESAMAGQETLSNVVLYVKSLSLTMAELAKIQRSLPQANHCTGCISFAKPDEGEVEIVLFAESARNRYEERTKK